MVEVGRLNIVCPNRKSVGAVGSVNVQIVVQLSKDLSGGLEFGTMMIS